jgi:hypothetical protein
MRLNLGMTGFGKSALLKYQLSQIRQINGRYILVDPTCDDFNFAGFGTVATAKQVASILGPRQVRKFEFRVQTKKLEVFEYLCWEAKRQGNCFFSCR